MSKKDRKRAEPYERKPNRAKVTPGTSRFIGVCFDKSKKKFRCTLHVGFFDSQIAAAREYNRAVVAVFGPNVNLNKVPDSANKQ